MSFREKHLWISIVAALGVWGFYFWSLAGHVRAGRLTDDTFAGDMSGLFVGCVVVVALVEIVLTLIATVTTPRAERDTRDEREILAALKASHVAFTGLVALVFCVAMAAYFAGLVGGNLVAGRGQYVTDVNAMVVLANVLVACVVVSEVVRAGVTLVLLRGLR